MDNILSNSNSNQELANHSGSVNGFRDLAVSDISLSDNTVTDDQERLSNTKLKEGELPNQTSNTKEEKQRLNEEIVIFESSSLSSEAGSWEPIFPPRIFAPVNHAFPVNQECEPYYREVCDRGVYRSISPQACFIDAANLADEVVSDVKYNPPLDLPNLNFTMEPDEEGCPTIFEMTPITEDSLSVDIVPPKTVEKKEIQISHLDLLETVPVSCNINSESQLNIASDESASTSVLLVPPNTSSTSVIRHLFTNYCDTPDNSISTIAADPSRKGFKEIILTETNRQTRSDTELARASYSTSWVIDMSGKTNPPEDISDESAKKQPSQAKKGSCFYIDLNDVPETSSDSIKKIHVKRQSSYTIKQKDVKSMSVNIPYNSENKTLCRLFPDLNKDLVKSTPAYMDNKSGTNTASARVSARMSNALRRSQRHSHSGWSLVECCESKLGKELLKMFLEETATDVAVEASGRKIKAHKSILASRCQYFAGLLGGGYVESAGNVIILPSYTYNVVHFAICNIYSGVSYIPPNVGIVELAALADMLGLDGLKDAIAINLEAKYCHNFHNPCEICIMGVLQCLNLSSNYGLEELLTKCVNWTTTFFYLLWPTEGFITLPVHLQDKCYQQHIVHFSLDTLLQKLDGCTISVQGLPNCRWATAVKQMIKKLVADLADLISSKLKDALEVILNDILNIPQNTIHTVHDCVTIAIRKAPLEQACLSYRYLNEIFKVITVFSRDDTWLKILDKWYTQCECILVSAAPKTISTKAFKDLPDNLKTKLRELGCIEFAANYLPNFTPPPRQKSKSMRQTVKPNSIIDQVRASFSAYSEKPVSNHSRSNPKLDNAPAYSVRMTKAQMERMKYNRNTSHGKEVKKSSSSNVVNKFENTKSRYMETRRPQIENKNVKSKFSSSDESRVSPLPSNKPRKSKSGRKQTTKNFQQASSETISQDSLVTTQASSVSRSESQTSNRFGTFTKSKKPKIETQPSGPQVKRPGLTRIPIAMMYIVKQNIQPDTKVNNCIKTSRVRPEYKSSPSLMAPTKSSSAKMIRPTVTKTKSVQIPTKSQYSVEKCPKIENSDKSPVIPKIMERSGTFSKDEPTFADRTTKID